MRPLLCALAGLALLRAAGADAGEWGPGGRAQGRAWRGGRELEMEEGGRWKQSQMERERDKERGKTVRENRQRKKKAEK